jgi:hypothetical protein
LTNEKAVIMPKPKPEWLPRAASMVPGEAIVIHTDKGVDAITHHLRGLDRGHKAFRVRRYGDLVRIELLGLKPVKKRVKKAFNLAKAHTSPKYNQPAKVHEYASERVIEPFYDDVEWAESARETKR